MVNPGRSTAKQSSSRFSRSVSTFISVLSIGRTSLLHPEEMNTYYWLSYSHIHRCDELKPYYYCLMIATAAVTRLVIATNDQRGNMYVSDANNPVHQVNHTTKARNLADRNPSQVPSGRTVYGCATPSYRDYRCWGQGQSSIENCQSEHNKATTNLFLVVV